MDKGRQSPKQADSDVAQLTSEQMRMHWQKMMQNAQKSFPSGFSIEDGSIPLPPFGLTPTMIMQLALMQNPLISMAEGKSKDNNAKSEVKDNKSNNTAHGLVDSVKQQSPSSMPTMEDLQKNNGKQSDKNEKIEDCRSNLPSKKEDTLDIGNVVGIEGMDEKDLKRLKRKQSNRESARRSRMRKQAECEGLLAENVDLKAEILQLKKQHEESKRVIASLQDQLQSLTK